MFLTFIIVICDYFNIHQRDSDAAARKKIIDDAAAAKLRATKAATAKVRKFAVDIARDVKALQVIVKNCF